MPNTYHNPCSLRLQRHPTQERAPTPRKTAIAHTIEQARQARSVDRVVVSTDGTEIAQVARRFGAGVIWRPAEISGDTASSESALLHAVMHLRSAEDYTPDLLVFLQCTSPLTLAEDIAGQYKRS